MEKHLVIDGNAFYEVDEECMKRKCRQSRSYSESNFDTGQVDEKTDCREAGRKATGWDSNRTGEPQK